jgi:hypothetical protein
MNAPTDSSIDYIFGIVNGMTDEAIKSIKPRNAYTFKYDMKTIGKILGINVFVNICVGMSFFDKSEFSYGLYFTINGKNSSVGKHNDDDLFYSSYKSGSNIIPDVYKRSRESVKDLLVIMHNTIPSLVINIERDGFILIPIDEGFGSVYVGGEECSVCYEKTTTMTQCKHYLCIVCYSNMQKYISAFNCPICRALVHHKYEEYDDSEESEDE